MTRPGSPRPSGEEVLGLVRAAVEPVLAPRGFAAAQAGWSGGELGVTWCAGHDDLAARFPGLPSSQEQPVGVGACVDVVLTARHDGSAWRLSAAEVEGAALAACLDRVGDRAAAARAGALDGAELEPAASALRELLDLLFVLGGVAPPPSPAGPAPPRRG